MKNTELDFAWLMEWDKNFSDKDWILWWNSELSVKLELAPVINNWKYYWYNQAAQPRTRMACTMYSAFGCVTDLTWYIFTLEQILEICDIAEKDYEWNEAEWGWLHKAIDCVRHYYNEKVVKSPGDTLMSFKVEVWGEDYDNALEKWYSIQIWYRTKTSYYKDSQDNWNIDLDSFMDKNNWGHAVRVKKKWTHLVGFDTSIVDNYDWHKKYNEYTNEKIEKLKKDWMFFDWGYLYLKVENMTAFKDIPSGHPFAKAISWAKENWLIKGYSDWEFKADQPITRWELVAILNRFEKHLIEKNLEKSAAIKHW